MKARELSRSIELFTQGQCLMPRGVSSPIRAFNGLASPPIFIARARGSRLFDVDGNEYLDFANGLGPIIVGHGDERLAVAVERQAREGMVYGLPTEIEYRLAAKILQSSPAVEQLRFVCSGTEAVMSALRLAKAFTRRRKHVKFVGCYHGHSDALLARGASTTRVSAGIDPAIVENTIIAQFNDLASVEQAFADHGPEIAAVVVEPLASNMGLVKPVPGFLEGLRKLCDDRNALLLFDEVVTGFRYCYGSVSNLLDVRPDLVTFGKIIGGGTPIGAYGGRADIMRLLGEQGGVFQGGTFAANPLSMAAGVAALDILSRPESYARLEFLGALLERALRREFELSKVPLTVVRQGSVLSIVYAPNASPPRNADEFELQDAALFSAFHFAMLQEGFLLAPAMDEPLFLSLAHSEHELESFAKVAARELAKLTHKVSS